MFAVRRLLVRLLAAAVLALPAAAASGATLPAGFADSTIARPDGQPWDDAVGLTVAADGRVFVWERAGRVWVVDATYPHAAPLIDLSAEVGAYGELGLTGFALDPSFADNGRVYLFYAVDPQHLASCDTPRVGQPLCRTERRGATHGPFSATISRLARYTLARTPGAGGFRHSGAIEPGSRIVLLGESTIGARNDTGCVVTATVHGAGSLAFGNDGTLLASCGDGASNISDDLGSAPGTDYATALSNRLMGTADNVGAFRSQRVDSLSGKVLRLDPATGDGLDSNPFYDGGAPRAARSRVWVLGLRNPERFAVRPESGSTSADLGDPGTLYIGDAGRYAWESLDVARGPRLNFGWPLFEGMNSDSVTAFDAAGVYNADAHNPLYPGACHQPQLEFRDLIKQDTRGAARWPNPCRPSAALPASVDLFLHTRPAIDWLHGRLARWAAFDTDGSALALPLGQHSVNGITVRGPLFGGSHSVGGTWYPGADFPASLRNVYFHADAGAGWIKAFTFDANDNPVAVQDFIDGAGAVRALAAAPSGGLYYVAMANGSSVHRIRYQAAATAGSLTANPTGLAGRATISATIGALLTGRVATSGTPAAVAATIATQPRVLLKAGLSASAQSGVLTGTDVGAITTAGVYGYAAPTYSISGAGTDIQGAADAFQFFQTGLTGDGSITARVATDSAPDPWTKAGVMIRETLGAGATNAMVAISGSNGAVMQYRTATGSNTTSLPGPGPVGAPYWVRLARNGNVFTGAVSADGLTWTQISQLPLSMATQAYVGLAMTSHSASVANTTFDSLSIVTAPATPAGLNVTASGTSALVSWSAAAAGSNGIGGYYLYRNGSATPIATVTSGTSYTDSGLNPAGAYSYQVAAYDKTTPTPFISPTSSAVSYVAPGAPSAPTALATGAISATSIALSWTPSTAGANGLGGYYVYRNNATAPLAAVTAGTSFVDTTVGPNTTYSYQVAAFDKTAPTPILSALSASVSATTLSTLSSGQTWSGTDIGATGIAGSYSIAGSQVVVNGGGADIWQSADAFQFVSQPFNGNGTITARVVNETNTNAWTKAGVMIRETLGTGAANAFVAVTPGNGSVFQNRATTGAASVSTLGPVVKAPYWVRLNRTGSVFTGSVSADGATWTQVTQYTIAMGANAYVGLALSSHNFGALATAAFDSITLSGGGLNAPSTPTGLSSTSVTNASVTLQWTAAVAGTNPLSGYYVYRNGSTTPLAIVAGTTYTDTSVGAATTYTYTVAAFDCSTPSPLVSAPSGALSVTTAAATATPPGAPASLTASGASTTSISLSWHTSTAGSNGIGGYYVYRNGSTTPTATVTTGTTYLDTGLASSTTYSYQVAAFDKTTPAPLVSARSATASATTQASASPPAAPSALSATAAGTSSIGLSWVASSAGANGIGGYYVYRNGGTTPIATVTTGTAYTDTGLASATTYTYQVAAFDKTTPTPLVSALSVASSATTAAVASAPAAPTGLAATSIGSTSVTLGWTASTAGSNGIGGYYVYRNGAATPVGTVTTGTTYTDTGLSPSTAYTYQLAAFDKTTPSPLVSPLSTPALSVTTTTLVTQTWSGTDIGVTGAAGSYSINGSSIIVNGSGADIFGNADAFQFVSQPVSGDGTITARVVSESAPSPWTKAGVMFRETLAAGATHVMVPITPGNGAIIESRTATNGASTSVHGPLVSAPYWVRVNRTGSVFTGYISADGNTWTQIGQYTFTMANSAYVGLGVTSHSAGLIATATFDSITISGPASIAPSTPSGLASSAVTASSVTLNWNASTAGTNPVAGYYVYRNGAATPLATVTSGTSYTDSTLTAATTYTYTVAAFDTSTPTPLVSAPTAALSVTSTSGATAPGAPSGLVASVAGSSSIGLSWVASSAGSNGIGGYYVYRNGGTTPIATVTTGTAYTDTGLASATTYTYQVAAFDKTTPTPLVSVLSVASSATTAAVASAPAAPTGLAATSIGSTSVTLGWTASTAGSNGIGGYYVYRNGAATPVGTVTTGTTYTDTGLSASTAYAYQLAAFDKTTPSPLVSPLSTPALSVTTTTLVTQTWSGTDIGVTGAAGSYSINGSSIIVNGSGADIFGNADAFQFVSQPVSGDGTITARVVSESAPSPWTKAGVMFRETLAAGATHVMVPITPGNGAIIESRTATNGASTSVHGPLVSAPYWVRVNRTGSVFTGYISADGNTWTQIGQYTFTMANSAYVGLGVTSHSAGLIATATFDSITISGPASIAPSTPSGLASSAVTASSVTLNWNASTAGTNPVAGYYVYRNGAATPLATVTSGTSYTDSTLTAATTYTYTVAAFDTSTPTPLVSAPTAALSVTSTSGATAPGAPSGLVASVAGSSSIGLSWVASSAGSNGIGGYYVYRNGGTTPIATVTTGTAYTDTGLASATTYTYQVAAFDKTTPTPLVSVLSVASAATTAGTGSGTPPAAPTAVHASAATDTSITLSWSASAPGSAPVAGYLIYRNGAAAPVGVTTTTTYTDNGLGNATGYTYTVVAYDTSTPTALLSAPSATASLSTTPVVFSDADVGVTGAPGSAAPVAGLFTLNGSGADIWGTADAFNYDSQTLSGDGTITARVVSQTNTDVWAKAGVMIRATTDAGAVHAFVAVTPGNGAVMQYRSAANGTSTSSAANTLVAPYWVRLTRSGSTVSGYVSPDGNTWTLVGQVSLPLPTAALAGLAVSSHSAGVISTVTFDSVTVTSTVATASLFAVTPRNAGITLAQTQQYTAALQGTATAAVTWSVDGIAGGSTSVGTISSAGLYTPPATTAGRHVIAASSTAVPALSATATLGVTDLGGVYTYHQNAARTGQNGQEYALTASNVAPGSFGKLFSCAVDGEMYAQPVYVANLSIGGGVHNVVFAVTMHDTVYAFDADSPSCVNYWTVAYAKPDGSVTSVPVADTNLGASLCDDIATELGITGTPVIDPVARTIYFVTKTKEAGNWYQRLHALDLATGAEKPGSPATINAQVTNSTGGTVSFSALWQNQRAGLALANGQVYIASGSHCDNSTWHGWVLAYNAATLQPTAAFNSTPNGTAGGIWMSGGAPAVDASGNLYVTTGNGTFDYTSAVVPPLAPTADYGESYLKLSLTTSGSVSTLAVSDFYTPSQNANWTSSDLDLSSSGVAVLPDGAGPASHPNLVAGSDKQAHFWLLDRSTPTAPTTTSMGGFSPTSEQVVQYVSLPTAAANCPGLTVQGTPTYWNNTIYTAVAGGNLMAIPLQGGLLASTGGIAVPSHTSTETYGYPIPTAVVSSTPGATSGIVWALDNNANGVNNCNGAAGPAVLRAYDATTLATLYSSALQSNDAGPNAIKFQTPIVVNGHVYVAGSKQLTVYGLLP